MPGEFACLLVDKSDDRIARRIDRRPLSDLPDGDLLVRVRYSSLNYKDALAATAHPGVVRRFPHVPGIDAAGEVVESRSGAFSPGDPVIVTGYELGAGVWGGWAERIRVPAEWALPLPERLTLREAMIYGTAGLTAGLAAAECVRHGIAADSGKVLVTGASGGVGSLAVGVLARIGFHVVAATGKPQAEPLLRRLGAQEILTRDEVLDTTDRPLLTGRWAAAVDTVGGPVLASILRSTAHSGLVAACGLVAGAELNITVFPFLLRGVHLAGIDSAWCPPALRQEIWTKLAAEWRPDALEAIAADATLEQLEGPIQNVLAGRVTGRTVVTL
jgi:acrylyl-CoA reductase (NADPH)